MNVRKKLPSDFEKLSLLNRLLKIQSPSKNRSMRYKNYSNSSSKKNNLKTFYLQNTNPSSFMPNKVRLIKKQADLNSLSPNSFRNSNLDYNNRSFDAKNRNLNKIYELKNSLGNPKYARNMMINQDLRKMNYSYDNRSKMKYLYNSGNKMFRNRSFNILPINEYNNIQKYNSLGTESKQSYGNNQYIVTNDINEINLNLDNLTYLEGLLNDIISALNSNNNIFDINAKNECFQFLKYYKKSSLFNKFPLFFNSNKNQLIIKSAFNLHLFIVIITYYLSSNQLMMNKLINLLRKIFYILKTNFFLIIHQIESLNSDLINDIHFKTCHYYLNRLGYNYINENEKVDIINNNCISIANDSKIIINLFQVMNDKHFFDLRNLFLNISRITEQDIYNYFYTSLSLDDNTINSQVLIQKEKEDDKKFLENIIFSYKLNKVIPPFLDYKSKKKYTVVLDLEDTLLNIKLAENGKLVLNLRPGLISFLSGIKPYYEIISFSKFSKSYSNTIINYIQQGRKLFDVNLYREHCALIGKKFIKDISRIGRDMKRIIMVDDLPENLERFKSNGILILPYEGEEQSNDRVLYELKKLMILFYKLGYDDIRKALNQYKDDITEKITFGNIQ